MAVALVQDVITGIEFPPLDLEGILNRGVVRCLPGTERETAFCEVPIDYSVYLPPVLRLHAWDDVAKGPVVDSEGVCYIVLHNDDRLRSKNRKAELDGLQAIVGAVWEEERVDLFQLPICCSVQYMSFRVLASPLELWTPGETSYAPFLDAPTLTDSDRFSRWTSANEDVSIVLQQITRHIPRCRESYPVSRELLDDQVGSLWLSVNRQKLVPYCPMIHLLSDSEIVHPTSLESAARSLTNLDSLAASPIVYRDLLRRSGLRVRHSGRLLQKLSLPVIKQFVVRDMLSRSAKWMIRRMLGSAVRKGQDIPSIDLDELYQSSENDIIADACAYFGLKPEDIEPYLPLSLDAYTAQYCNTIDFHAQENRSIFPHAALLDARESGSFPKSSVVGPHPIPNLSDDGGLSAEYAANIYELEMRTARGSIIDSVMSIADLVETISRMRDLEPRQQQKEEMRLKILALCEAARAILPPFIPIPSKINHALIQATFSTKVYQALRSEVVNAEGSDSVSLFSLDSLMASHVVEADPELATTILTLVTQKAERTLGMRNPVTISAHIRKAQAVRRLVEVETSMEKKTRQNLIQDGIRSLNRVLSVIEIDTSTRDSACLAYHLLAVLSMWSGESVKAVSVSRQGLQTTLTYYGKSHPRYLNAAFLHAKLLEDYAASLTNRPVEAVTVGREAVDVLENLFDIIQDLSSTEDSETIQELTELIGMDFRDSEIDMKRKLAIVALLLKLNVWLLDPATASDLLDLVVSDRLSASKGVLVLPNRAVVREYVTKKLRESMATFKPQDLPVVEFTESLPEAVLLCCKMALLANSKGIGVSVWFKGFCHDSLRLLGDNAVGNRDILATVFMHFLMVSSCTDGVYVGPLSQPLVPRTLATLPKTSSGVIYRDWAVSATLFCLDHELYKPPRAVDSPTSFDSAGNN
jgi:hypothetical protein